MFTALGRSFVATVPVVAALAFSSPAMSSDAAINTAPTYDDLLTRLDTLPSVREAVARHDAATARVEQARALPNPSMAYSQENVYGSGPYRGAGSGEMTLSLTQPLELFGKRTARIEAARSEANAANLRRVQVRWQLASQLAWRYAEAEAAARRYELAAEALSLTEQDANGTAALVEQGREPLLRAVQAQSEVQSAKAALDEARALRNGAFAQLSAVAMLDSPIQAIGTSLLDRVPEAAKTSADAPIAIQLARADFDTASQQVKVEQRRALPDISVTVGKTRFQETADQAFTLGIELSIPLFDRNRGGIRAAYAEQQAAEARLMAQQQAVHAGRLAAEVTLSASNSRTRAADSGVAAAEEAYRLSRIGFEAGRISQLELRSTRAALIAARNAAVDARLARVLAEIDLALLEGRIPFGASR